MPGRYQFAYSPESTYGRAVRLLGAHAAPGGVVLDLGCGYGPAAAPLQDAGFGYVGLDLDEVALADLAAQGFETRRLDLGDAASLPAELSAALGDRPAAGLLLLDCVEHLVAPSALLEQLAAWCAGHGDPTVVVSLPNVSHTDLAMKLVCGRWDMTDVGLLDRTHVSFFTEARVDEELGRLGWRELGREDVVMARSEQAYPAGHPYFGDGAPVVDALRWLRDGGDPTGETYQFVRALRLGAPTGASRQGGAAPPLTVVVRAGEDVAALAATLQDLAEQELQDFDVLIAHSSPTGDEPTTGAPDALVGRLQLVAADDPSAGGLTATGLQHARGDYLAVVDAGQRLPSNWVKGLVSTIVEHPGRVARLPPPPNPRPMVEGEGFIGFLTEQLSANQLPVGSFAVPRQLCRPGAVWAEPGPAHESDWGFATTAAMLAGVADAAPLPLAEVPDRVPDDRGALARTLRPLPLVIGDGVAADIVGLHHRLDVLRAELAATRAERDAATERYEQIATSEFWRATGPLRAALGEGRRAARAWSARRR